MDKAKDSQPTKEKQKSIDLNISTESSPERSGVPPVPVGLQRVIENREQARPSDVIALRNAYGNRAAHQFIQPKLMVGPAGDAFEQEADRVADQVMNIPTATSKTHLQRQEDEEEVQASPIPGTAIQRQEDEEEVQASRLPGAAIQRQEDEEEVQASRLPGVAIQRQEEEEEVQTSRLPGAAIQRQEDEEEVQASRLPSAAIQRQEDEEEVQASPIPGTAIQRQEDEEEVQTSRLPGTAIQRQEEEEEVQARRIPGAAIQRQEEEEEVQAKPSLPGKGSFRVDDKFEDQLKAGRGHGDPLPVNLRKDMETRLGSDFQGVRIHHSSRDAELNRSISAQAFTLGQDIYMGSGKYEPHTMAGKRLLAHELTHVVQQSGSIGRKTHLATRSLISRAPTSSTQHVQRMMNLVAFKQRSAIKFARRGKTIRAIDQKLAEYDAMKVKLKPDLEKTSSLITQGLQLLMAIEDLCRMWLEDHKDDTSRSKQRQPAVSQLQTEVKTEIGNLKNTYKVQALPPLAVSGKHQFIKDRFEANSATSGFERIAPLIDWIAPPTKKAPPSTQYEETKGSLDVTVDIPVAEVYGVSFTIGFHINANVERNAEGQVKFGASVGVVGGAGAYVVLGAKAELAGYIESQAKTSKEVIRLFSFMLYRKARESKILPSWFASAVWGGSGTTVGYRRAERWAGKVEKDVFTGTQAKDVYVESGIKGGVSGSVGDPFGIAGVSTGLQGSTGRRYDVESLTSKGRALGQQFARPVGKFYAPQPVQGRSIETVQWGVDLRAAILTGSLQVSYKSLGKAEGGLFGGRQRDLSFELYAHALVPFTGHLYDLIGPKINALCMKAYDAMVAHGVTHTLGLKSLLAISKLPDPQLKLPQYIGKVFNAPLTVRLTFQTGQKPKLNLEYGFDIGGGGGNLIVGAQVKRSRVLKTAEFSGGNWAWLPD